MNAAALGVEFAPPPTGGVGRALVLAVLAHLVLLTVLTLGVQWRRSDLSTPVQAELWSALPKAAAPRLVEAPPPSPPAPPVVAPPPAPAAAQADIALQREQERRAQEKRLAAQQRADELRKKEQRAAEKQREQERLAALEKKREQAQQEKERKERERLAADRKREQERQLAQKKQEQAQRQAQQDEARTERQRQDNLQRIAGLAGASGAPGASGSAQRSSGPSASYGGRVSAIVKPNIVYTETSADNPSALVEVRAAPDGTITGRKLLKSSGNPGWDAAVLKALDKTATLPRDSDGTVPAVLEIHFRRHD